MRILLATLVIASLASLAAHQPDTVEFDQLKVGMIYYVEMDELHIHRRAPFGWSKITAYGYHILKVIEIKRNKETGGLWYEVLRIEPQTLDRSRHIRGLVWAKDLKHGTVTAAH